MKSKYQINNYYNYYKLCEFCGNERKIANFNELMSFCPEIDKCDGKAKLRIILNYETGEEIEQGDK